MNQLFSYSIIQLFNYSVIRSMKKLVILYLLLLYNVGAVFAQTGTLGTLSYVLDENGTLTISGTGDIPFNFIELISSSNIFNDDVQHIVIEQNITGVGIWAFKDCKNLTSVSFPATLTKIDGNSFDYCTKLSSIDIPASVTYICQNSFQGCSSLSSITVQPGNMTYSSADGVLFDKNKTTLVICPPGKQGNYSIPSSVEIIGMIAFHKCEKLGTVTIPNSVTVIENYAFMGAGISDLTIPEGVKSIGLAAFQGCINMTAVSIPASLTTMNSGVFVCCPKLLSISVHGANPVFSSIDGVLIDKINKTLVTYPMAREGSYTVPEGIETIDESAFFRCQGLKKISFSSSVKSIGNQAFYECTGLTFINLPATITNIGDNAFALCQNLVEVVNNKSIPQIISSETFSNPSFSTRILRVPSTAITLYKEATEWKGFKYIVSLDNELSLELDRKDISMLTNKMTVIKSAITGGLEVDNIGGYSSNINAAMVDNTGRIWTNNPGSTVITFYFGSMLSSCTATVIAPGNSVIKRTVNNSETETLRVNLYMKPPEL